MSAHGTVYLPVHGIQTQAVEGDHVSAAKELYEAEGPSTVSVYWADIARPGLVEAYREAGHRCVTLGQRHSPEFLDRLIALFSSHRRVVSNRLSTPVVYAAWMGRDVAVYGDPMRLEGEDPAGIDKMARTWPEFYGHSTDTDAARAVAACELGEGWLREPHELSSVLGWDAPIRMVPFLRHWVSSPMHRALVNVRRRSGRSSVSTPGGGESKGISMSWLIGAASYLPKPVGRIDLAKTLPIELT